MQDISLKDLLEAGCHFGHKVEKWHPKAVDFIYQAKEGIHIIDLAKTREGLKQAALYFKNLAEEGKTILFVATKRQAKGVVAEAAKKAGLPYLAVRWIGGFLTNWEEVKKNIEKLNRMRKEKEEGVWNKFPKHEILKLEKYLRQLEIVYGGVANLTALPDALFIVDIKKEAAALKEAKRVGRPIVAIVDTNTNPYLVDYPIPANDDAVGSIRVIVNYLTDAFLEGKSIKEKGGAEKQEKKEKLVQKKTKEEKDLEKKEKSQEEKQEAKSKKKKSEKKEKKEEVPLKKKRGRPKKSSSSR